MTKQQQVIEACKEQARTAAELCQEFGVTRFGIYGMCKRGLLRKVGQDQASARYSAGEEAPKPVERKTQKPQWDTQQAIKQASSVWHYAQRMK